MKKCNKCNKVGIFPCDIDIIEQKGMCWPCYTKSKGLVKHCDHYVPWGYQNYFNTKKNKPVGLEYHKDSNASLPTISRCPKYEKWKVAFVCPDTGGYDTAHFVWYFDNKEDIFKHMRGER